MFVEMNLQLFNEAGAESSGVATSENLGDIKYGIQETEVNASKTDVDKKEQDATASRELEESFEDLIKGKFKDDFNTKVKDIVSKRLKGHNDLKATVSKMQTAFDLLATRYGLDSKDIDSLVNAIKSDDELYESIASTEGMSASAYRDYKATISENQRLKENLDEIERERAFNEKFENWIIQAEEVKAIYPEFDFSTEWENEQFFKLIDNGVSLKSAYEALHSNEIIQGAMAYTAKRASKETADKIASRGSRPIENGMSSASSVNIKSDVSKLTKEDRERIAQLVLRGEVIRF